MSDHNYHTFCVRYSTYLQSSPCAFLLMMQNILPKRLFFYIVATSAILDIITGSNFRSWSSCRSDIEQNYLGVLGIIWTAGWDFPIIGFCDTVLLAVCCWNDFRWWWEIGKWRVFTLFTPLSAINTALVFIVSLFLLPLHSGHIFCTQNKQ